MKVTATGEFVQGYFTTMSVIRVTFLLCTLYHVLGETTPDGTTAPHRLIAQASNRFTLMMYNAIKDQGGNIFISPFSLEVLLALLYLGSNGAVKNEIQGALHLPDNECIVKEGFKELIGRAENSESLEIATKMFAALDFQIKQKFQTDARNYFYSGIDNLDFLRKSAEAVSTINSFVAEKTHNKITELFDNLSPDTVLVLVNALYFKADWLYTFPPARPQKFYITNENSVNVDMMHITGDFSYKHDAGLKAQIIEIPYKGKEYSMLVILPEEVEGLTSVENKLASANFEALTDGMTSQEVVLSIPKFKMEKQIELNDIIKKMGMATMFQPGIANLSGIADGNLYVSKAIQKTYINVDEKGTEAAAATGIAIAFSAASVPDRKIYFIADHPFMFVIIRKPENSVVFLGRLVSVKQ